MNAPTRDPGLICTRKEGLTMPDRWTGWGNWYLDPEEPPALVIRPYPANNSRNYKVDLTACGDAAQILDWICQVAGKEWANDAVIAGLVRALDDTLNPPLTICPDGDFQEISGETVRALVAGALAQGAPTP